MLRRSLAVVVLLAATHAHAQTGTGTPGTGTMTLSCSGSNFTANLGLLVFFNGMNQNISSSQTQFVFDTAECQCNTQDIQLQLQVTAAFPIGSNGQLQVWTGTGCEMSANRVANSSMCGQVMNTTVTFSSFVTGTTSSSNLINVPIPSANLFNPLMPSAMCAKNVLSSNNFYLLFAPNGDFSDSNIISCKIPLQENTQQPNAPTGLGLSAGDSAVSLSWTQPQGSGETVPISYQVLCANADGTPIAGKGSAVQAYSVCSNGIMHRRNNYITAGAGIGTTDDGGVTPTDDMGFKTPFGPPNPVPEDVHTDALDGGVDDGGVGVTNSDFATSLDPAFICSDEIKPTGTSLSVRVGGLTNNVPYQFVVLSIDQWGNPTPGPLLIGTPQPTEDLYTRYRNAGGTASGFCFIATAAFGSYEDRYVKVLRDFRDEVLLPTTSGRAFVDWYYAHSPPLADFIARHYAARVGVQLLLWPVIAVAAVITYTTPWQKALLCTLLVAFLLRRRMRRAVRA